MPPKYIKLQKVGIMKLTFLGAAGTVTGSKYLLELQDKKILIDCGLFQGLKELRLLNWQPLTVDPATISAVLLTHGHLDHVGYLPHLVKLGFAGKIYATAPTLEIAELILKDSAKQQEDEADRANREGYSKHTPALPLYGLKDVGETIKLFCPIEEGQSFTIKNLFKATFQYNGHILGSTYIQIEVEGKTIVFSGDIGRKDDLLLYPPKKPSKANVILMESTYGGTLHTNEDTILPELAKIVNETINRGGSLFIPTFAVERTQLLMLMLWRLIRANIIPKVPMIMDSPMGAKVLDVFRDSIGWHKLNLDECSDMCSHFQVVSKFKETLKLRDDKSPKIIIAGSGMLTGGRILNYLETSAANEKDTLLFVGYQAKGTRGRALENGAKEIKVFGKWLPFAMQVRRMDGLSGHADQDDLIDWLSEMQAPPEHLYIIHGETDEAQALKQKLMEVKHWEATIPALNQSFDI